MPIQKIDIEDFLNLSLDNPVLDVRSPAEYIRAHIPAAFSVPLFTDAQRAEVGTAYIKESRQSAVDIGLGYFSERMKTIPTEILKNIIEPLSIKNSTGNTTLLIHCWRGGMRSDAVAWLLNLYNYKIYVLRGGYKAFRRWALSQFEKTYQLKVVGGYSGSGKTEVLKELKQYGKKIIDLEALANHKGSAFGALGEKPQPGHEMYENLLAMELRKVSEHNGEEYTKNEDREIWLEDESNHIGAVGIPKSFWSQMRKSPLFFLDIPFEKRLEHIVKNYGVFDTNELVECTLKIQKRLGGLNTKNVLRSLSENNYKEAFAVLLKYYDKMYQESLHNRENIQSLLNKVSCSKVSVANAEKLASADHSSIFLNSD